MDPNYFDFALLIIFLLTTPTNFISIYTFILYIILYLLTIKYPFLIVVCFILYSLLIINYYFTFYLNSFQ
jgi:hypothetical protein